MSAEARAGPAEQELVAAAQSGSAAAFGLLVERHYSPLLRYLTRQAGDADLAADLAQQTFVKADGSAPVTKTLTLPANQRTTVVVHEAAGAGLGPGFEVSTRVTNNGGAGLGILVERVMYFRRLGDATGGSAALGVP